MNTEANALATHVAAQLVPAGYAEKAMASLMQLHTELMDEKERRVELFRRLMEREQALAELRMYVKMLEEKAAAPPSVVIASPVAAPQAPVHDLPPIPKTEAPPPRAVQVKAAPMPPRVGFRPRPDGWKVW